MKSLSPKFHILESRKNSNIYKELAQSYKFINICKDENNDFRPVAHWLNFIKNAQYVITDSFHGSVFSIIFKKKFVTVATALRGNARIESLCRTLDIPLSRFYPSLIDISPTFFDEDISIEEKINNAISQNEFELIGAGARRFPVLERKGGPPAFGWWGKVESTM